MKPELLIAVQDRCKHNKPNYAYGVIKHFVLCSLVGGEFVPNIETTGIGWFAEEELPDSLATAKIPANRYPCASGRLKPSIG